VVSVTDDLIAAYLVQLKAGLRTTPERARQILAEAEDHLRESAAAGEAMVRNMLAQDAAEGIDAFLEKRDPKWSNR